LNREVTSGKMAMQMLCYKKFKLKLAKFSALFILLPFIMILSSCGKGKTNNGESEYFSFDKSSLGIEVVDVDLGIKFNPPVKWNLRQTMISRKIESRGNISNPGDNFIYKPTYVFFNDSTGGLLSVGKVISNDSTLTGSAKLNYYKGLLSEKTPKDKLSAASFINSKIYFSQFKIQKENLISVKLVFENLKGDIIQFDYSIRSDYLEGMLHSIKSSIGSIGNM
jgi:hypothetical protein